MTTIKRLCTISGLFVLVTVTLLPVNVASTSTPAELVTTCNNTNYNSSSSSSSSSSNDDGASSSAWQREMLEHILADDYEAMDKKHSGASSSVAVDTVLLVSIAELKNRGAHRCWHKHSTFLQHLLGVHNILRLWGQGKTSGRVGLFHSAYANSYVNLALFDPETERTVMESLVGQETEVLVHMFCTIDRQSVVVNTLLPQGFIPPDGISVPHLRDPQQQVFLSFEMLRLLVVFTMADIADQYFGWQDRLFGGTEMINSMLLPGTDDVNRHDPKALWPGMSQPGLFMSYVSELGAVLANSTSAAPNDDSSSLKRDRILDLPPIFNHCTNVLSRENEMKARDLYWSIMDDNNSINSRSGSIDPDQAISMLRDAVRYNPWAFEPHVMLAQKYLHANAHREAKEAAARALELQLQWGTAWDKRMSFAAWVAWTRVLYQRASADDEAWPTNSWQVNNFGLVRH